MKTASFFTYTGPGRVSIARFAPRGTPAGYRCCKRLAPGPWFKSVTTEEYVRMFDGEILRPLVARVVRDELLELTGGVEPVLLCWEKPGDRLRNPAAFCHRSLVARWLEQALGEAVPEIGFEGGEHPLLPIVSHPLAPK